MVVRELLQKTINTLKAGKIDNAVFDANLIVRKVLKLSPIDMVLSYNKEVNSENAQAVENYTKRRCLNEPLQYILKAQEFMGLEFYVDENVLIPRADTETLTEAVLKRNTGMNVLDICTGSGCIALSIAHYNKKAYVTGLDISEKALDVAKRNAENLNLSDRVRFIKTDILKEFPFGVYDVITANPPYIESEVIGSLQKEVRLHEPRIALDGGEDGLVFYRRITEIAPRLLAVGGRIYFEVGYDQAEKVKGLMRNDFENIEVIKDLCGKERVVCGEKSASGGFFDESERNTGKIKD